MLLPLLPMLLVLLGGTALWAWLLLGRRGDDPLGLGQAGEPRHRSTVASLVVVGMFLPLQVVAASVLGASLDSRISLIQAGVLGNLLTVALGFLVLLHHSTSPPLVCWICGAKSRRSPCTVCGAPLSGATLEDEAERYGLAPASPLRSLRSGLLGFVLAYPAVVLALMLSSPLRSVEKLHPFLKMLGSDPGANAVAWIVVAAVLAAPLAEELVFRVALQGWLRNHLRPGAAIATSSLLFSVLHGWPDMIGLLPLAIVLGVLYERTNDYATVVVTHMAFNGLNVWNSLNIDPAEIEKAQRALEEAALVWTI